MRAARVVLISVISTGAACSLVVSGESGPGSEDGGELDAPGSGIDSPHSCDDDTLVLFPFDGADWATDSCSGCVLAFTGDPIQEPSGVAGFGEAVVLDGGTTLRVPESCLQDLDAWTVEMYVRPDQIATRTHTIASLEAGVIGTTRWNMTMDTLGRVSVRKTESTCAQTESVTTSAELGNDRWSHLRFSYGDGMMAIAIDGVEPESDCRPSACGRGGGFAVPVLGLELFGAGRRIHFNW